MGSFFNISFCLMIIYVVIVLVDDMGNSLFHYGLKMGTVNRIRRSIFYLLSGSNRPPKIYYCYRPLSWILTP